MTIEERIKRIRGKEDLNLNETRLNETPCCFNFVEDLECLKKDLRNTLQQIKKLKKDLYFVKNHNFNIIKLNNDNTFKINVKKRAIEITDANGYGPNSYVAISIVEEKNWEVTIDREKKYTEAKKEYWKKMDMQERLDEIEKLMEKRFEEIKDRKAYLTSKTRR